MKFEPQIEKFEPESRLVPVVLVEGMHMKMWMRMRMVRQGSG